MLHLHKEDGINGNDKLEGDSEVWKVLVFDKFGCDIIAPLIKVGELREQAVTLHL